MKIKDVVDLKGCYSAYEVGEKEIDLEVIKDRVGRIYCYYLEQGYCYNSHVCAIVSSVSFEKCLSCKEWASSNKE